MWGKVAFFWMGRLVHVRDKLESFVSRKINRSKVVLESNTALSGSRQINPFMDGCCFTHWDSRLPKQYYLYFYISPPLMHKHHQNNQDNFCFLYLRVLFSGQVCFPGSQSSHVPTTHSWHGGLRPASTACPHLEQKPNCTPLLVRYAETSRR